jgi:GMP synthase (glutamine-hydrolysing)
MQAELVSWRKISLDFLKQHSIGAVILSGGPHSVYDSDSPHLTKETMNYLQDNTIPILGLCYGHQFLSKFFNGIVEEGKKREYGKTNIIIQEASGLFSDFPLKTEVWMSHGDKVTQLPEGFLITASSENCKIAAFENRKLKIFGLQFHPEVTHTQKGGLLLSNFLYEIADLSKNWTMEGYLQKQLKEIPSIVGEERVLIGVSGGVDSTVSAVLLDKCIKDQLVCVFIDHGLMRKNEVEEVEKLFTEQIDVSHFHHINAQAEFLNALKGVIEPEKKRKIIGHKFIEVFERVAHQLEDTYGSFSYLAQGTIYPDRIESSEASEHAAKIKTHHNIALPEKMALKIIEPLKELYKDEVRSLGEIMAIPFDIIHRHPFPGPGLAVRIIGEITSEKLQTLKEADAIFINELKNSGEYDDYWQSFAVLLPVKSVGVMGDSRTYEWTIVLRSVDSIDAMTADWSRIPYETLVLISNKIINNLPRVNRVVYDITSKPPATIEWE